MDLPESAFSGTNTGDRGETTGGMLPATALIVIDTDEHKLGPSTPASHAEIERL
jgi:hypothetical protein